MPLISVIIPCYNQAAFLPDAVESVLAQTVADYEILVIDDGSPDNTSEVAGRYPTVRCIRQANRGLAGARNRGLNESRGEYLLFLDADDRILPNHFEVSLAAFAQHPYAALVCGNYRWFGAPDTWHVHDCTPSPDHYGALLRGTFNIPIHTTLMWRPSVMQLGGFNEQLSACEDIDFFLRFTHRFLIHCHHELVAEYRRHPAQMTRRPELIFRGFDDMFRSHRGIIAQSPAYQEAVAERVRHLKVNWGEPVLWDLADALRQRSFRRAAHDLRFLLHYYPEALIGYARGKLQAGRADAA
jgi:glycosyltransferase involved in cell wall biosynthesis